MEHEEIHYIPLGSNDLAYNVFIFETGETLALTAAEVIFFPVEKILKDKFPNSKIIKVDIDTWHRIPDAIGF